MLSPVRLLVRLSVRLLPSVTQVDQSKSVEVRIMKFSIYGSPFPLVFMGQVSSRNSKGFPASGVTNEGGVGKTSHLLALKSISRKTVGDTSKSYY